MDFSIPLLPAEFKVFVQECLHINQQDKFKDWFRECDRKGENKIYKQAVLDIFKELVLSIIKMFSQVSFYHLFNLFITHPPFTAQSVVLN